MSKKDFLFFWKIALTIRNCCAIMPMFRIRRHSQAVRQRSAKPLFPGSNPGGASKTKKHFVRSAFFVLERCLPLRASDVAFGSDVHFVSDVSPCGEVGKHHITLRRRSNTSLCVSTTSLRRSRNITQNFPLMS